MVLRGYKYLVFDEKEPVEMWGGTCDAATIMEFWTMKGYTVVFFIGLPVVTVRRILGGDEREGSVLSYGSFEDASYGNHNGVGPVKGDPLSF